MCFRLLTLYMWHVILHLKPKHTERDFWHTIIVSNIFLFIYTIASQIVSCHFSILPRVVAPKLWHLLLCCNGWLQLLANYIFQLGNTTLDDNKMNTVSSIRVVCRRSKSDRVRCVSGFICRSGRCLRCDALSEKLAMCSIVSLYRFVFYRHYRVCLVYKCNTKYIFYILLWLRELL